ncbi:MAG: hypothetical protein JWO38_1019 [Gemmataceae bacterium]|nr:hypothetical protein [Gemmataceae bacterium]
MNWREAEASGAVGGAGSAGRGASGVSQSHTKHWHDAGASGAGRDVGFAGSPQQRPPFFVGEQHDFAVVRSQQDGAGSAARVGAAVARVAARGPVGHPHALAASGAVPTAVVTASSTQTNGRMVRTIRMVVSYPRWEGPVNTDCGTGGVHSLLCSRECSLAQALRVDPVWTGPAGAQGFTGQYALTLQGDQLGANYNDTMTLSQSPNDSAGTKATMNGESVAFNKGQISTVTVNTGGGTNTSR